MSIQDNEKEIAKAKYDSLLFGTGAYTVIDGVAKHIPMRNLVFVKKSITLEELKNVKENLSTVKVHKGD